MRRKMYLIVTVALLMLLTVGLMSCLPKFILDKDIIGIVSDDIEHKDFDGFDGYIFGDKNEKYNLLFRLKLPENYDKATQYPLVVYLHFLGAQGTDNESQMLSPFVEGLNEFGEDCIVFIPQLAKENMAFSSNFYKSKDMSSLYNSCLNTIIDTYNVDKSRIYLTGVSMGSHNTWELINKNPNFYAAAMPISFGTTADKAESLKNLPIYMAHSSDDNIVEVETAREIYNALKAVGGNVKYKEYNEFGHGTCFEFYKEQETWNWLFAQKKAELKISG